MGGSGKQSLTRLAASVSGLEIFQIQLRKGYSITDLKADVAQLYMKAGVKNIGTVFLLTDAQVSITVHVKNLHTCTCTCILPVSCTCTLYMCLVCCFYHVLLIHVCRSLMKSSLY